MRNTKEPDDREWAWVAQAYRTPPVPPTDAEKYAERLFQRLDEETAESSTIPTERRQYTRFIRPVRTPGARLGRPQRLMAAAALILVVAGGVWIGRAGTLPFPGGSNTHPDGYAEGQGAISTDRATPKNREASQTKPWPNAPSRLATGTDQYQPVEFVVSAPHASRVTLVGDFNAWDIDATPMESRAGSDRWTVSVPLPPGRHVYAFVIDGAHWIADPAAPRVAADAFGAPSSVRIVGGFR